MLLCRIAPSLAPRAAGGRRRPFASATIPEFARAADARDPRLVVVILRGALDGLSAVAPIGDPDYAALHGDLALQVVRWQIMAATSEPPVFENGLGAQTFGGVDPNKYDLVRAYVGMNGAIILSTMEVVAEYAVDFDFAFSFETGTATQPVSQTFWSGDTTHNPNWVEWTGNLPAVAGAQPQRLRSLRVRLATRVAQPDRSVNIPANAGPFLYRYCLNAAGCAQSVDPNFPQWARTRTITTDVSMPNLATDFY